MNTVDPIMAELRRAKEMNAKKHKTLAQYAAYLRTMPSVPLKRVTSDKKAQLSNPSAARAAGAGATTAR
jgi:hypothetical protein